MNKKNIMVFTLLFLGCLILTSCRMKNETKMIDNIENKEEILTIKANEDLSQYEESFEENITKSKTNEEVEEKANITMKEIYGEDDFEVSENNEINDFDLNSGFEEIKEIKVN